MEGEQFLCIIIIFIVKYNLSEGTMLWAYVNPLKTEKCTVLLKPMPPDFQKKVVFFFKFPKFCSLFHLLIATCR
jgi:hypothetical protein